MFSSLVDKKVTVNHTYLFLDHCMYLEVLMVLWRMIYFRFGFKVCFFAGNKAKGRILKRVLQEIKALQIFRKTNILYTLIRTLTCAYHGVRNVRFSENLGALISCNIHFKIRPFALLPTICYFCSLNSPTVPYPIQWEIWIRIFFHSFLGYLKRR